MHAEGPGVSEEGRVEEWAGGQPELSAACLRPPRLCFLQVWVASVRSLLGAPPLAAGLTAPARSSGQGWRAPPGVSWTDCSLRGLTRWAAKGADWTWPYRALTSGVGRPGEGHRGVCIFFISALAFTRVFLPFPVHPFHPSSSILPLSREKEQGRQTPHLFTHSPALVRSTVN